MGLALCLAVNLPPVLAAAPATAPAAAPVIAVGDSITPDQLLNLMADKFGAVIVTTAPLSGTVVYDRELPSNADQAIEAVNEMLMRTGYQALASKGTASGRLVLRITSKEEAKAAAIAESPVTYGLDPLKIDISDRNRIVTHVIPLTHSELLDTVEKSLSSEKDVTVTVTGEPEHNLLVLAGPAISVRHAVQTMLSIDTPPPEIVVTSVRLRKLNAQAGVDAIDRQFNQGNPDKTLRAFAYLRTNTVTLSGDQSMVTQGVVFLQVLDAATPEPPPFQFEMPQREFRPNSPGIAPASQPGAKLEYGNWPSFGLDVAAGTDENTDLPWSGEATSKGPNRGSESGSNQPLGSADLRQPGNSSHIGSNSAA
jgi:hypothetical protein